MTEVRIGMNNDTEEELYAGTTATAGWRAGKN